MPPTIAGESMNGSARCGGGRPPSVQAWTLAGVRLPPLRASSGTAPCGVAAPSSQCSYHRHMARVKTLPSLANDDYVLSSFHLLGGIIEELICLIVVVFAFCYYICGFCHSSPWCWGVFLLLLFLNIVKYKTSRFLNIHSGGE